MEFNPLQSSLNFELALSSGQNDRMCLSPLSIASVFRVCLSPLLQTLAHNYPVRIPKLSLNETERNQSKPSDASISDQQS